MKKILMLSYDFPPMGSAGAIRVLKFAKYFKTMGWNPLVVTSTPKTYYFRDDSLITEAESSGVEIHRTRGPASNLLTINKLKVLPNESYRKFIRNFQRIWKLPDEFKNWIPKALKLASDIIESGNVEAVFASAPPFSVLLVATELKKRYKIPLIADYRDSWLYSFSSYFPTGYHRLRNQKMEAELARNADLIVTVNRRIKENLISEYDFLSHKDIHIVHHVFDPKDFKNTASGQFPEKKTFRITHTGNFFDLSSPRNFLKAMSRVFSRSPEMRSKFELCFIGGLSRENLKQIQKYGLSDVVFNPGYISHADTIKYIKNSHLLWFYISSGKGSDLVSPLKLSEYIGSGKPIIACVPEGAAKQLVKDYEPGKIADPEDAEQIADLIMEFYELYEKRMVPQASADFISRFNVENVTRELVKKIEFLRYVKTDFQIKGEL